MTDRNVGKLSKTEQNVRKLFLAATTLVMLKETHINSLSEIQGKSFVVFRKYKSSCVFAEISALFVYVKCTPCGLFWRL